MSFLDTKTWLTVRVEPDGTVTAVAHGSAVHKETKEHAASASKTVPVTLTKTTVEALQKALKAAEPVATRAAQAAAMEAYTIAVNRGEIVEEVQA